MYLGKCTVIVLILFWSLVEVHSQTAPYVSFMGVNLPNHSYVDLTTVGDDIYSASGGTVRCHTDLETCCTGSVDLGNWYFPDGDVLPFAYNASTNIDIVEDREPQVVHIRRRNNAMSPSGIYCCVIETVAVNDNTNSITGETVYVGLYPPNEGIFTSYIISCIIRRSEEIMS